MRSLKPARADCKPVHGVPQELLALGHCTPNFALIWITQKYKNLELLDKWMHGHAGRPHAGTKGDLLHGAIGVHLHKNILLDIEMISLSNIVSCKTL